MKTTEEYSELIGEILEKTNELAGLAKEFVRMTGEITLEGFKSSLGEVENLLDGLEMLEDCVTGISDAVPDAVLEAVGLSDFIDQVKFLVDKVDQSV